MSITNSNILKYLSKYVFNKRKKEETPIENIVTKSGFTSSLKWNGRWFSSETVGKIHLILPFTAELKLAKELAKALEVKTSKPSKSFLKAHTEGVVSFNSESWVIALPLKDYSEYKSSIKKFLTSTKTSALLLAVEQKYLFVETAVKCSC